MGIYSQYLIRRKALFCKWHNNNHSKIGERLYGWILKYFACLTFDHSSIVHYNALLVKL